MKRWHVAAVLMFATLAQAQQSVILVRHAELDDVPGVDAKRISLSGPGEARAQRLAQLLQQSSVSALYATDFARTSDTAQPLAKMLGREVTILGKGDAAEFVTRLRREHAGQNVVVVGHTDTLPGIIRALGHPDEIRIDAKDYGNIFVVTPRADSPPSFLRLRY
jgi:broad specificity phosphatase PhoE